MKIPAHILEALLLARGDDPRPFTKALWITAEHVLVTNGHRMHLWYHGQEWVHGDTPVPFAKASTEITKGAFLPVMGATLPDVERYLPKLPTVPTQGEQHARIRGKYLEDAQEAIRLALGDEEGFSKPLYMTDSGCWTWCNGEFLVCVAPLKETDCQLKGFEK